MKAKLEVTYSVLVCWTYRRSQSPIAMRPSCLGPVKRKFDLEEDKGDQYLSPPAKRLNSYPVDRGGLLMAHSNRWA
jgi:hypothetical protein